MRSEIPFGLVQTLNRDGKCFHFLEKLYSHRRREYSQAIQVSHKLAITTENRNIYRPLRFV